MTEQLLHQFDSAIETKSETGFFKAATTICRKYAHYYAIRNSHVTEDWELIADEAVMDVLELVRKTKWTHSANYYFACLRNKCKWLHLANIAENKNVFSLEQITTSSDGENFLERCDFTALKDERTYNQEIELKAVHRIMQLADAFKDKKTVEAESGIDHKTFLRLVRKYQIQFYNGNTGDFLAHMKVYNIYLLCDKDMSLTRQYLKNTRLNRVKHHIRMAEHYIDMFKTERQRFINRFVLPPNQSSWWDKTG